MTQENRFAIIIGFAMLLVVGILVSDHLAEVVRGAPGTMAIEDPLGEAPRGRIEYLPLVATADRPGPSEAIAVAISMRDPHHRVAAGETMISISSQHYGDPTLAAALARHNAIPDPARLREGTRLMIPPAERLTRGPASAPRSTSPAPPVTQTGASPSGASMLEYEVQSGDTLSELAQQLMGTARATQQLLDLNRDRLSDPDTLAAGVVLRYPASP